MEMSIKKTKRPNKGFSGSGAKELFASGWTVAFFA